MILTGKEDTGKHITRRVYADVNRRGASGHNTLHQLAVVSFLLKMAEQPSIATLYRSFNQCPGSYLKHKQQEIRDYTDMDAII